MMIPKVLVIIPTAGDIKPETARCVHALSYEHQEIRIQQSKPVSDHENHFVRTSQNATHTRNQARKHALKTDATHFLFIDSDVAPPPDTIQELLSMDTEVAGGWYPVRSGKNILPDRWVAGTWVDHDVFANYHFPWVIKPGDPDTHPYGDRVYDLSTGTFRKDPIKSDLAPLGCVMISRDVLELMEFEDGTDQFCKIKGFEGVTVRNDCLQFGVQLCHLGVDTLMSPRIKCEHIA